MITYSIASDGMVTFFEGGTPVITACAHLGWQHLRRPSTWAAGPSHELVVAALVAADEWEERFGPQPDLAPQTPLEAAVNAARAALGSQGSGPLWFHAPQSA